MWKLHLYKKRAICSLFLYNNKGVVCEFLVYGLPNITGGFNAIVKYGGASNGAIYSNSNYSSDVKNGQSDDWGRNYMFNASRCSSIYGASNTVQPSAIKMLPIIRY